MNAVSRCAKKRDGEGSGRGGGLDSLRHLVREREGEMPKGGLEPGELDEGTGDEEPRGRGLLSLGPF